MRISPALVTGAPGLGHRACVRVVCGADRGHRPAVGQGLPIADGAVLHPAVASGDPGPHGLSSSGTRADRAGRRDPDGDHQGEGLANRQGSVKDAAPAPLHSAAWAPCPPRGSGRCWPHSPSQWDVGSIMYRGSIHADSSRCTSQQKRPPGLLSVFRTVLVFWLFPVGVGGWLSVSVAEGAGPSNDGGSCTAHPEDLDVLDAAFAAPDLAVFCCLDELGLVDVGRRPGPDRAVK